MTPALPPPTHVSLLLLTMAVFALAGLVKGVLGLGLPTIAMALLGAFMTPAEAAALLIVPSLVTNVWQIRPLRDARPVATRLASMQLGVVVGTLAGAWTLGAPVGRWAVVCLGAMLVVYAAWSLAGARLVVSPRAERRLGPWVGATTGFITSATGVFVLPAVPYLQALGLQRDALMTAMGLSFTVSTLALAVALFLESRLPTAVLGQSTLMLLPAIGGMAVGQRLRERLSPAGFRLWFLAGLLMLGGYMIVNELVGG